MIHPTAVVGDPPQMRDWWRRPGLVDPPFHPPRIADNARVGALTVVDAGYERPTVVGERTWLMCQVHVAHDVTIGCDCEIATGTVIAGYCEIGDRVKVGVNATLLPYVKVGDDARIGAGAVVTKDVPAGETWVGNPARPLRVTQPVELHLGFPVPELA